MKKILSITMALALSLLSGLTVHAAYGGGDGTEANPYQIETAAQLKELADEVNNGNDYSGVYFKLMNDIDLGGNANNQWTPIGNNTNKFKGIFDGGGFKISGLYINGASDYQGLFGYVGIEGAVKKLGVDGEVMGSGNYTGGVVGVNCGTVQNCYNTGAVTGSTVVGGVVGVTNGTVQNCYNTGIVTGSTNAGGVVGANINTVQNCYNTGTVTGGTNACGGVVGISSNRGTVQNFYNIGAVTGVGRVGSVVGTTNGTVEGGYYLSTCGADDLKADSLTEAQFTSLGNFEGWDTTVWTMSKMLGRPVLIENREDLRAFSQTGARVGEPFFYDASSGNGADCTFKLARGIIPAGLTLDESTGIISGTPTSCGLYPNIWIQTTDASGRVSEAQHSIFIKPRAVTVQITECDYTYTEGKTYQAKVRGLGGPGGPVLLTVTYGANRTSSVTEPGMYAIHIHAKDCEVTKIIDGDGNERSPDNIWLTVK